MTVDELIAASINMLERSTRAMTSSSTLMKHYMESAQVYADLAKAKALESRG